MHRNVKNKNNSLSYCKNVTSCAAIGKLAVIMAIKLSRERQLALVLGYMFIVYCENKRGKEEVKKRNKK